MARRQTNNRRASARVPADVLVRVYANGRRIGDYHTRDVSETGLGLSPGRVMFLPGMALEVEVLSPRHRRLMTSRLPATVRYCRGLGMGLKLRTRRLFP
ncbi:PilZ domain-containing protein [Ectothiorhodospiraceae bacterium WFHF3C12]|nr:PilZ domain-containing protein [Ectothiorhodospiraceae bacterium WFHF3C12]